MSSVVKVTDSMGDHWVCDGVSVYPTVAGGYYIVPALVDGDRAYGFPTIEAACDAIRTHLKGGDQ